MDFAPLLVAAMIVGQIIDVIKGLRAKDWNLVVTIVAAWVAGTIVAVVLANSDFADQIKLGDDFVLGDVNGFSVALFGVAFGTLAGQIVDFKKAFDNADSQKKPSLLPSGQ